METRSIMLRAGRTFNRICRQWHLRPPIKNKNLQKTFKMFKMEASFPWLCPMINNLRKTQNLSKKIDFYTNFLLNLINKNIFKNYLNVIIFNKYITKPIIPLLISSI